MLESELEKKFTFAVKRMGGLPLKFVSPNCRGVPDRLVLFPGGVITFAEIKRPGGKLRKLQEYRKKELENLGFRVWVIDSDVTVSCFCKFYERKK